MALFHNITAIILAAFASHAVNAIILGNQFWNLRCRSCHNANSLEDCNNYIQCGPGQQCYTDELIMSSLKVAYQAGCRSDRQCGASDDPSVMKRQQVLSISCSRCCNDEDFCNQRLCGLRKETTALMCLSCDGKDGRPFPPQYADDCAYLRICDTNEVCFAKTTAIKPTGEDTFSQLRHFTSCIPTRVCSELLRNINSSYVVDSHVGKRAEEDICAICSGRELFNHYACTSMKTYMINLIRHNKLNWTTMDEIRTTNG
ncbi:uncharacterized protein LOC127836901 isoform X1 [Dreissena polymorpha]|uniref:Sodefrin-like factor n=1 Tax=Dreissena polymorpha TaxID=45954 RepID=A0A9D4FQJ9_DREPO|nr:uncharacterized protein LOC127836901 isoform X1 [Dreissena polymorpha]KAH3800162.1 hypothetical protein DPMN_153791 [Dreissena polymorpha]